MGKNYKLNQIPLRTEEDALEFIDMVSAKLPLVKNLIKKGSLERQSLRNRLSQAQATPVNTGYSADDVQTSVLQRATGQRPPVVEDNSADRIAQLRAAQEPLPPVDPGEIGHLDLDSELATDDLAQGDQGGLAPTEADLVPIGTRVAGKAEGLKTVANRIKNAANDLRKK